MRQESRAIAIQQDAMHATVLLGLFFPLLIIGMFAEGGGRYALYAMPPVSLLLGMVFAVGGRLVLDVRFGIAIVGYLAVALVAVVSGGKLDFYAIRDMILVSGSFAIFLPYFRVSAFHIKGLFLVFILALVAMAAGGKPINTTFDIVGSQGVFENQFAFCFGVIAIYFFIKRDVMWSVASLIVLLVSFKRITIAGVILVVAMSVGVAITYRSQKVRRSVWLGLVLALTTLCLLFAMFFSLWADQIAAHLGYGGSVDAFTMGRMQLNAYVDDLVGNDGMLANLLGHGPGTTTKLIVAGAGVEVPLHNDYKKIVVDYGWIGGTIILLSFIRLFSMSAYALHIMAYTAILFVSDNTFIYMYYYVCCFFVVRALDGDEDLV